MISIQSLVPQEFVFQAYIERAEAGRTLQTHLHELSA